MAGNTRRPRSRYAQQFVAERQIAHVILYRTCHVLQPCVMEVDRLITKRSDSLSIASQHVPCTGTDHAKGIVEASDIERRAHAGQLNVCISP